MDHRNVIRSIIPKNAPYDIFMTNPDALTRRELDVLPDFGVDGKEFGVAEVIAHAFEQFIGPRIKDGFFVRRRDGQGQEAR